MQNSSGEALTHSRKGREGHSAVSRALPNLLASPFLI